MHVKIVRAITCMNLQRKLCLCPPLAIYIVTLTMFENLCVPRRSGSDDPHSGQISILLGCSGRLVLFICSSFLGMSWVFCFKKVSKSIYDGTTKILSFHSLILISEYFYHGARILDFLQFGLKSN